MTDEIDNLRLSMWTVYQSPTDYPGQFVARRWICDNNPPIATSDMLVSPLYEDIRRAMIERDMVRMQRNDEDDPVILETWI